MERHDAPGGFEWDARKAVVNARKHGVGFAEAATVFKGSYLEVFDDGHSGQEHRYLVVGLSDKGRFLSVIYTPRGRKPVVVRRLISARRSTAAEIARYLGAD
jgi:uncharacterized DUF497 family protein